MILIGQYDSPFVRRVGIALHLYGIAYEQQPWSTFGDADKIAPFNPLRRVPTLVLDDGEVVIESGAILDYVDEIVGADSAMIAKSGPRRRQALKVCALATGLADKAVSPVYERVLHDAASEMWIDRCRTQIGGALDVLNANRQAPYWFGDRIGLPGLFDPIRWPALAEHASRCEALPAFQAVVQVFDPARK